MTSPDLSQALDADATGVRVRVTVQPNASRAELVGLHGDTIKVRVTAPPEDGRANIAVAELVAGALGVRARDVVLLSGHRSRHKVLHVEGLDLRDVTARLDSA